MSTLNPEPNRLNPVWRGLRALVLFLVALSPLSAAHAAPGPALLAQAKVSHWIAQGQGKRVVYVLFDPNCPYCHVVYKESQAHLKKFQFRWIPVGILTRSSPGKAAALLDAPDPVAALRENEDNFVMARGKLGGIAPAPSISMATASKLEDNLMLLQSTGMAVVPKIFFLSREGKVRLIEGALSGPDFSSMLDDVAGGS